MSDVVHTRFTMEESDLEPERALDTIDSAYKVFVTERMHEPAVLVLGVHTYWSLCIGVKQPADHAIPVLTDYCGVPILVDDDVSWRVKFLPKLEHARHDRKMFEVTDDG